MEILDLDVNDCTKKLVLTVKIKGLNVLKVRIWVACRLISLAAFVLGTGLEITTETKSEKNV